LLEKRESLLRYCGIFHVVCGARTVDSASYEANAVAKVDKRTGKSWSR
jgi:hypothetical protein